MNSNSFNNDDESPADESTRVDTSRHHRNVEAGDAPSRIGRYEVKAVLGRGAFGSVYQGWDTSLQRAVAIKVLHRTSKDNQLQKWLDEARTVAALDHPAIVPVYDVGQTVEGCGYMVSKLIDGGSLNDHKETNSLDFVATVGIVARIAAALDYAHRQKIVHRDVKPANILISSTGEAALSDFGLALHESEFGAGARFVGTPSYMSPEQARHEGHRVDGRSDIYSVGVVLYELLVGVRPFRAATPDELLDCIRNVEVRPLRQINRSVPRELERICLKSLSKRAADRHTTAGDLSEDLLNWISERQVTVATDSQGSTGSASHQGSGSQSLETVSVVPRGLRPFDAADSDFFLHLVPGAKDREGVPECVRFWRSLIDEQNEDSTFRVGVLLGPSGSGKSSLVRAGIVPRLDPSVITIRVEARPEGLERHLLHRLKSTLPELKQANSLPEAMAWIRGRRGIAQDAKLLVVIDQFEQWLNHNDSTREHELLEALRQCDGATLQTLLLVRDDFMLPVAEFMDALEEPLLQNHNFATVDLFGAEHTQEVLTAFGRAYSTIDDPPTTEQRHFLDAAVKELSSNGRVVPVHLALFADMIKDKSWTPAALRGLGGTRGVGMAFLEERLSGAGANPFFLSHAESVRRLLGELLPPDDSAIKPPARTLAELTDRLRDPSSSQWLERLLGLLDTEVRLVTPSGRVAGSPDSSGSASESGSLTSSREPRYQLTHDYLVPSIRSWLAFEERRTRSGRSRARLRELAHAWDVKPEARRLPSVWEWLSISGLTSASAWSETERRMMNAACRRLAWIAAILVFVGGSTWFVGRKVESRFRAASLAQRLVNADTAEVASILQEARPYDAEFKDALNRREHDDSEPRHKLNTSLAFVHSDRSRWDYLLDHLDDIRIEHLGHIRELTIGRNNGLQEKAWSRLDAAETNREKLLLSSLLAEVSPEDERWQQHRAALVQAVMQARPDHFSQFVEFLAPLRLQLSEELLTRLRRPENSRTEIQRHQLVEMSAVYVGVEPSTQFVEAVSAVTAGELPSFTARITGESNVRTELRRHFAELHNQLHPRNTPLEKTRQLTTLEQRLESLGGFLDGRGGLAQAVPREDFESLTQSLAAANYEPVCVRPFSDSGQPLVAGVWQRGNAQWKIHWELDPAEAKTLNDKLVVQGFLMRDMAWSSTVAGQRRLSVLWIKPSDAALKTNQETFIDITLTELLAASRELGVGWGVERFAVHHWPESETRCCAILRRVKSPDEASVAIRMRCAFGDVSPGLLRTDVRFAWLDPSQPDRTLLHLAAAEFEDRAVRSSGSSAETAQLSAINYLSAANQLGTAEQRLAALASEKSDSVRWRTYSAYSAARSRDLERLEGDIDWFQRKGRTSSSGAFRLQAAALRGDLSRVEKLFETEREASKTSDTRFVQFLQALGTVAGMEELGEIGNQVTAEFNRGAREVIEERRRRDPALLFSSVDFDGARSTPEFQTLMREKQMDQCYTTAAYPDARYESRILFGLSSADHRSRVETLRRGGFLPVSICASTDPKTGEHQVCSSWRRAVVPAGAQARISRSLGNVALVLASLGESDLLMDGLNDRFGRDVRSYLTLHSPVLLPSSELVQALRVSRSSHERRAIVQTLGSFYVDELSEVDLEYATLQLQGLASTAADAGLRNSSVWALKSWGIPAGDAPAQSDQPSKTNNWFVNSVGQTMIIVRPPETFVMGSPAWEAGRQLDMDEYLHHAQLGHDFAMSATEVSVNQFEAFWNDPKVKQFYGDRRFDYNQSRAPEPDCPQIEVSWLHAARFCQWLSEREGIPKEQWCYPGVWDPDAKSIALPDDYRLRRGYRLPAQMEWEFAAHRGSSLTRYCGSDTQLLSGFEWTKENSGEISHVVGTLRPNDDGFWDLLGNVSEWCDDPRQRLYLPRDGFIHHFETGPQSRFPDAKVEMTARGGRYGWSTTSARAAERHYYAAGHDSVEIGFRVVKTVSESQ